VSVVRSRDEGLAKFLVVVEGLSWTSSNILLASSWPCEKYVVVCKMSILSYVQVIDCDKYFGTTCSHYNVYLTGDGKVSVVAWFAMNQNELPWKILKRNVIMYLQMILEHHSLFTRYWPIMMNTKEKCYHAAWVSHCVLSHSLWCKIRFNNHGSSYGWHERILKVGGSNIVECYLKGLAYQLLTTQAKTYIRRVTYRVKEFVLWNIGCKSPASV
jgi:hypothetical protein